MTDDRDRPRAPHPLMGAVFDADRAALAVIRCAVDDDVDGMAALIHGTNPVLLVTAMAHVTAEMLRVYTRSVGAEPGDLLAYLALQLVDGDGPEAG